MQEVGQILYRRRSQDSPESSSTERVSNEANRYFVAGILTEISLLLVFSAITASQEAIKKSNEHATAIRNYDDFGNDGEAAAVAAFSTAVTKIRTAFEKYGVRTTFIIIGPG